MTPAHGAKPAENAQRRAKTWEFWIDRGGTFTDIVGRDPAGRLRTRSATMLTCAAARSRMQEPPVPFWPLAGAVLWPVLSWLLLMPQRRLEREQML